MKNRKLFSGLLILLPIGLVMLLSGCILGRTGVLPDFWMGYFEGCGAILALLGSAFLIARLMGKRKNQGNR